MPIESLINLILLFFAYAFLGWCIEVTLKYFQFHRFINRGFLTGPWLPIYGSGAALIIVVIKGLAPLEFSVGTTFAVSFLLCGFLEYMTSYVLEKRFHARWWDYSQKPMGRRGGCGSDQSAVASPFRTYELSSPGDYGALPVSGFCRGLRDVPLCAEACQDKR